jgi:hypothetical protein
MLANIQVVAYSCVTAGKTLLPTSCAGKYNVEHPTMFTFSIVLLDSVDRAQPQLGLWVNTVILNCPTYHPLPSP